MPPYQNQSAGLKMARAEIRQPLACVRLIDCRGAVPCYLTETSPCLYKVLLQSLLPNHGANQSTYQAGRNDDHQHGDGGDIQHPVYVLLGNVVLLHAPTKALWRNLMGQMALKAKMALNRA